MNKSVGVINSIGAVTFLLLTLVVYLSLKGRLGVYIALTQAQSDNSKAPATASGSSKTRGFTSNAPEPSVPSLGALAQTYAPEIGNLNTLSVLQHLTSPYFAVVK